MILCKAKKALALVAAALLCAALAVPSAAYDDYPYKGLAPDALEIDEWGFYKATCTSFVCWRLINENGVAFSCGFGGVHWGNSNQWDDAALALGYEVDDRPAVGAVAQTDSGTELGHVAWVAAVEGEYVTVEEYNYGYAYCRAYNTRTVHYTEFRYIHIADLSKPFEIAPAGDTAHTASVALLAVADIPSVGANAAGKAPGDVYLRGAVRTNGGALPTRAVKEVE